MKNQMLRKINQKINISEMISRLENLELEFTQNKSFQLAHEIFNLKNEINFLEICGDVLNVK